MYEAGFIVVNGFRVPADEVRLSPAKRPARRVRWADVPAELRGSQGDPPGCQAAVHYGDLGPLKKFIHCGRPLLPGEQFCPMHGGTPIPKPPKWSATFEVHGRVRMKGETRAQYVQARVRQVLLDAGIEFTGYVKAAATVNPDDSARQSETGEKE